MIKILYISRHKEILDTVVRLLNSNNEWLGVCAKIDEEALHLFSTYDFALMLLGCGIEEESEHHLRTAFRNLKTRYHHRQALWWRQRIA